LLVIFASITTVKLIYKIFQILVDRLPAIGMQTLQTTSTIKSKSQLLNLKEWQQLKKLETVSIAEPLQSRQHVQNP